LNHFTVPIAMLPIPFEKRGQQTRRSFEFQSPRYRPNWHCSILEAKHQFPL